MSYVNEFGRVVTATATNLISESDSSLAIEGPIYIYTMNITTQQSAFGNGTVIITNFDETETIAVVGLRNNLSNTSPKGTWNCQIPFYAAGGLRFREDLAFGSFFSVSVVHSHRGN